MSQDKRESGLFGVKQLDKRTEKRLRWLLVPCAISAAINLIVCGYDAETSTIIMWNFIMKATLAIAFLGYAIAAACQKCWILFVFFIIYAFSIFFGVSQYIVDSFMNDFSDF